MQQSTDYTCDLAVSAVASDGGLVAELTTELASRLRTMPVWDGERANVVAEPGALFGAGQSRVALVLHQHLWQHDQRTLGDATVLRDRVKERRASVCVLTFDDTPVASWLARSPRYDVRESGRAGVIDFVIGVVEDAGGAIRSKQQAPASDAAQSRWPESPTPFLGQPRAQSALRHQLDGIIADLKHEVERRHSDQPDELFELHVLPHRVIARLNDVAISFSWVAGRFATVADGRLLVIAWRGVTPGVKGVAAMKAAAALHERTYVADGTGPDDWRWRADDAASQPYASGQLVADWLARACIAQDG